LGIILESKVQDHPNVGHDKWGEFAAIFSLCHIGTFLLDLGINQAITKNVAAKKEDDSSTEALFIKAMASLAFPPIMMILGYYLGYKTYHQLTLIASISSIHVLIQLYNFFRAIIQGKQLFGYDAILSNLDKFFLVIGISILLIWQIDLQLYISTRILSLILSCVVIIGIIWKQGLLLFNKPKLQASKDLLKKSLPFALIMLVYGINEKVDQVMVERLSIHNASFDQAGIYSASYRLIDAGMMYLWIVLPIIFAKFAHHETTNETKKDLLNTGTAIVFLPVGAISRFGMFHGNIIFELLFNQSTSIETNAMSSTFGILCFSFLAQGMFAILSTFLTSTGHERFVTTLVIISIVFNVFSNFVFIPEYGAQAAAWSTLGSALIVIIGYILFITIKRLVPLPYLLWLKLGIISIVTYAGFYYFERISTTLSIIVGILLFLTTILITKPLTMTSLRSIKK